MDRMTFLGAGRMLLVAAGTCGLCACTRASALRPTGDAAATVEAGETAQRSEFASSATAQLAEQFEALGDACEAADWSAAATALVEARENWRSLEPVEARAAPAYYLDTFPPNLRRAAQAIGRQAQRPCASEAYGLLLGATKLRELVDPRASGLERLRTWMRRVDLDAHYRDWQAAARDITRAQESWQRLGPPDVSTQARASIEAAFAACRGATEEREYRALRHATHAVLDQLSESHDAHATELARVSDRSQ